MKEIPLTQGKVAIVDDWAYPILMKYKWRLSGRYARSSYRVRDNVYGIYMHRLLLDAGLVGLMADHINGDTLDNRMDNLRLCQAFENSRNRKARGKFKGVCWDARKGKWQVSIKVNGSSKWLGYYVSDVDAAKVYDSAALSYYGSFARLNFP